MRRVYVVLFIVAACSSKPAPEVAPVKAIPKAEESTVTTATVKEEGDCPDEHAEQASEVIKRGAAFSGEKTVALSALLTTPEQFDKQTIATEGLVRQVCQKKGCWMELASAEKGPGVRITFKDYAFFVPKDSTGKRAKLEGSVKLAELSEERAKHYESEGATVPRGKDGKAREIQLVATAVEIAAK